MTISEFLTLRIKTSGESRLTKLKELDAPQVIIDAQEKMLENPLKEIGKIKEFGHFQFTGVFSGTGKGGVNYLRFERENNPAVLYVKGQWGWYLYETTKPSKSKLTRIA